MNILKPSYKIIRYTPDILDAIDEAARTCYLSEPRDTPELRDEWADECGDLTFEEYVQNKFLTKIRKMGHQTPFEYGDIEIEFICDRGVSHELVRHRLASPMQESTRYCNYGLDGKHGMNVIEPFFYNKEETVRNVKFHDGNTKLLNRFDIWLECIRVSEWGYNTLLSMGSSPQEARSVLPNSLKTKLKIKANVREWQNIFSQRAINSGAHPQAIELTLPALKECVKLFPVLFAHLLEK